MDDLQQSIYDDIKALNEALECDSDLSDLTDSEVSDDDSNAISIVTNDTIAKNGENDKTCVSPKNYTNLDTDNIHNLKENTTWTDQIFGGNYSNDFENGSSTIGYNDKIISYQFS